MNQDATEVTGAGVLASDSTVYLLHMYVVSVMAVMAVTCITLQSFAFGETHLLRDFTATY